ncbi:hypothetical protein GDO86_012354 [Hymenochirus boettgeri]|uniref:Cyclin-dependent kinase inhibitor domain-containing protein n=1 Tax=Hymenochirus boettgeri TaxID=247094 RepID=A0A8T2IU58_9PIPI|nr:hypothetical protein GDO86_012354 [Hymenochirus boettgeri]
MAAFNIALSEEMVPAAPTLPRLSLGGRGGACRSLFGPIDHDELRSELKRQLKEIQASDCQRWNFDFETGSPLKGTYCWEPLDGKDVPSFYSHNRGSPACSTPTSKPQTLTQITRQPEPREEMPNLPSLQCAKENADKAVRRCQTVKGQVRSNSTTALRKREITTTITDYFPKRKRTQVCKADTAKGSHPLCPLEQTPRKKIR